MSTGNNLTVTVEQEKKFYRQTFKYILSGIKL